MKRSAKLTYDYSVPPETVYRAITEGKEEGPFRADPEADETKELSPNSVRVSVTDRTPYTRCAMKIESLSCTIDWSCTLTPTARGCRALFEEQTHYPGRYMYFTSFFCISPSKELAMFATDLARKVQPKKSRAKPPLGRAK